MADDKAVRYPALAKLISDLGNEQFHGELASAEQAASKLERLRQLFAEQLATMETIMLCGHPARYGTKDGCMACALAFYADLAMWDSPLEEAIAASEGGQGECPPIPALVDRGDKARSILAAIKPSAPDAPTDSQQKLEER